MKHQIPAALIQFLRIIKLSRKETPQSNKTLYKELAVVLGTDDQATGFLVTDGSYDQANVYGETQNHQKAYWYFDTFEAAHSFAYGV